MSPLSATVVIGGGPAGLSAAIGLARAGCQTRVQEQRLRWAGRVCPDVSHESGSGRHLEWIGVLDGVPSERRVSVTETTVTWGSFKR